MNTRMNKLGTFLFAALLLIFALGPSYAMDDPGFAIKRMVTSENIADKEPVNSADIFPAATDRVYCFLETADIEEDTTVHFIWYLEGREMTKISLPLQKGRRWRTYSSKKVAGLTGNWKVELQEASGIVLNTITFKIQ